MKPHSYSKVILVGVAVVLVCGGIVAFTSGRKDTKTGGQQIEQGTSTNTQRTTEPKEADIVLKNLGLSSIADSTVYTRFAVQDYASNGMKGLYLFGDKLPGNRLNPNFEFSSVKQDAPVIAAIDGIVAFIKEQAESKDYEVFLQPKDGSIWTVGYDHLVGLKVKRGDKVKTGDVLGTAAVQNNGLYRFELQINKDVAGVTTHHCPVLFLDPAVAPGVTADLSATQQAWEAVKGQQDLYNPSTQSPVGCIKTTLSVAEAEGR